MTPYYSDASVTLYHADNREMLPLMEAKSVDCVLTDPPYDARTHAGAQCIADLRGEKGVSFAELDDPASWAALLVPLARRWTLLFCTFEMLADYKRGASERWVRSGVWDRVNPAPQISGDRPAQAADAIAIFHAEGRKRWNGGGRAGIWRYSVEHGSKLHETQKPLPLIRELVQLFTDPGETILDPFAGSGTTGLAARLEGRKAILIEREERYCEVAAKRLERNPREHNGQLALLGGER